MGNTSRGRELAMPSRSACRGFVTQTLARVGRWSHSPDRWRVATTLARSRLAGEGVVDGRTYTGNILRERHLPPGLEARKRTATGKAACSLLAVLPPLVGATSGCTPAYERVEGICEDAKATSRSQVDRGDNVGIEAGVVNPVGGEFYSYGRTEVHGARSTSQHTPLASSGASSDSRGALDYEAFDDSDRQRNRVVVPIRIGFACG